MTIPTTQKITVLLRSRESAERTVRQIVDAQITREKLIAARDAEVAAVNAGHNQAIDDLTGKIDLDFELLEDWADNNRKEEFGATKSIVISGHRLGWRTGNPSVKTRGKLTFKTIVARLVEAGGDLRARFIREKPELNKDAVLELQRVAEGRSSSLDGIDEKEREAAMLTAAVELREIGVTVQQTESFYFEPDRDGQPDIRLAGETKEVA
jgi:phage host-nuclease inhibitor protein Gam